MLGEVVQDGLPPLTLLFLGVYGFSIERDAHHDTVCAGNELNDTTTVSERILNQLTGYDPGVCSGEVKTEAAIFGFHA